MKAINLSFTFLLFLFGLGHLLCPKELYAQNCNQNNLIIEYIDFYDSNGQPFDPEADYAQGTNVDGQIFVTFGGSATNAYSLHFEYDVYINDVFSEHIVLCLFPGQNVIKETPQFINDFSLNWGDVIEFREIFMRWNTNNNTSICPTSGGSAQCYYSPGMEVDTPYIPLPVNWHQLHAETGPDGKSAVIQWSTSKEWEASHFEIERAIDSIGQFMKIAEVKAAGWSDQLTHYHYLDDQLPYSDSRIYYRLKQVDLNGDHDYSKTLSIKLNHPVQPPMTWKIYPNPSQGGFQKIKLIDTSNYHGEPIEVNIISHHTSKSYVLEGNRELVEIDLNPLLRNFPNGLLILIMTWGKHHEQHKIIKN